VVDIVPGSALETAYGGAGNLSAVITGPAVSPAAQSSNAASTAGLMARTRRASLRGLSLQVQTLYARRKLAMRHREPEPAVRALKACRCTAVGHHPELVLLLGHRRVRVGFHGNPRPADRAGQQGAQAVKIGSVRPGELIGRLRLGHGHRLPLNYHKVVTGNQRAAHHLCFSVSLPNRCPFLTNAHGILCSTGDQAVTCDYAGLFGPAGSSVHKAGANQPVGPLQVVHRCHLPHVTRNHKNVLDGAAGTWKW